MGRVERRAAQIIAFDSEFLLEIHNTWMRRARRLKCLEVDVRSGRPGDNIPQ